MKILIIQKKFMGDVLATSSILPLLKEKYPNAEIHFLLNEKHAQILAGNPYIDYFIFFKDSLVKTLSDVKRHKFDLLIDPYSKIGTGLISLFSGAETRIGFFKKYTWFFYTHPVKREKKVKSKNTTRSIEHRLQMLEPLGIPFREIFPKVYLQEIELQNAHQILTGNNLSESDNLIMISTFGSSEEKTYPIEYMVELLNYIADYKPNAKILCNYLPSQKVLFLQLYDKVLEKTRNAIVKDFDTRNLREFAAVATFCKCLIGNEGGATNLSKALDIPTFSIFSPQIGLSDWAWSKNAEKDKAVHLSNFVSSSKNYFDFKPSFFVNDLKCFLDKTVLN